MEGKSPHTIVYTSALNIPYFYNRKVRENFESLPTYRKLEVLGIFHKEVSGTVSYTPIGMPFVRKLEKILTDVANRYRLMEWEPPTLIPKKLFEMSGRYRIFKDDMMHIADNNHVLHPTGEEWFLLLLKELRVIPHKSTGIAGIFHITRAFRNTTPKRRPIRLREFRVLAGYLHSEQFDELFRYSNSFLKDVFRNLGLIEHLKVAEKKEASKKYHYIDYFLETPEGDDRYKKVGEDKYILPRTKPDNEITGTSVGMFFIDSELVSRMLGKSGYISAIGIGLDRLLYALFHTGKQGNISPFKVSVIPITRLKRRDDYLAFEKRLEDILNSEARDQPAQVIVIDSKQGKLSEKIKYARMIGSEKTYLVGKKDIIHLK